MAAATVAALLSAITAMAADENSQSQYGTQSATVMKGHRAAPSTEFGATTNTTDDLQEQAAPGAMMMTPISIETSMGARRRAALATLFLIGAAAPCLQAEGKAFNANGGC